LINNYLSVENLGMVSGDLNDRDMCMVDSVLSKKGKQVNVESSIIYINEAASKAKFIAKKSKVTNNFEHQREIAEL